METHSLALLAAVAATLAYTGVQICFKRSAGKQLDARTITAYLGLLWPFWALILAVGIWQGSLTPVLEPRYFLLAGTWAVMSTVSLLLLIWLLQKLSLIELNAYRRALTLLTVGVVDVVLLGVAFNTPVLAAVALMGAGAWLLSSQRAQGGKAQLRWPQILAGAVAVSVIMALQLYFYKQALLMQPQTLAHVCMARMLACVCSLALFAHKDVPLPGRTGLRTNSLLLVAGGLYFFSALSEAFAIRNLPLLMVSASAFVGAAILAAYDIVAKELPATRRTWLGIGLVFAGFVAVMLVS